MKHAFRFISTITLFFFTIFIAGCAGRTPNPAQEYQYGDESKSCDYIKAELISMKSDINNKMIAQKNTGTANAILFVTGFLFLWPLWLAMDISQANEIEATALSKRHNTLLRISNDKKCDIPVEEIKIEKPKPVENKETKESWQSDSI
ncbi:MAG: hypothetical protein HYV24_06515 [Deltaproteobacteria bacterium]|nr:hypothetical protein [Deltaproteobacteria bacterium]